MTLESKSRGTTSRPWLDRSIDRPCEYDVQTKNNIICEVTIFVGIKDVQFLPVRNGIAPAKRYTHSRLHSTFQFLVMLLEIYIYIYIPNMIFSFMSFYLHRPSDREKDTVTLKPTTWLREIKMIRYSSIDLRAWLSDYIQMKYGIELVIHSLTHWGRDKMDVISQTTCSSAFSWMKILEFRLKFHWSLFLRVQLTIFQHWFR